MNKNSFLLYKVRHCFYSSSMNGDEFINDEIIDAMKLKFVPFSNKNFLLGFFTQVTGYIVLRFMLITPINLESNQNVF